MAANNLAVRTPEEWFRDAERAYTENHQGCPWCGGSYRVYRQRQDTIEDYYCQACEFQATFDQQTAQFRFFPGNEDAEDAFFDSMSSEPSSMLA